jgi:type III secretory pathway component EscU
MKFYGLVKSEILSTTIYCQNPLLKNLIVIILFLLCSQQSSSFSIESVALYKSKTNPIARLKQSKLAGRQHSQNGSQSIPRTGKT